MTERAAAPANGSMSLPPHAAIDLGRQVDACHLKLVREPGPDARSLEVALHPALGVDPYLFEPEEVLHGDYLALHAGDLGNVDDPSGAVAETGDLDHHVNGRGYLLADGAHRQGQAGHQDHVLDTGQAVAS